MSASARLLREKKPVNYKPAPLNRSLTVQGDTVTVDVQGAKPGVSPNHRDKVVTEDGRVFFPCPYCSRAFTDKVNRAIHLNTCPAKSYILSVASAARTDELLGPKTEKDEFINESVDLNKTPSFSEEEQRAFMQAVQLAKVNEIISDDDGKTVITRMTYNKRALQKAKLVAALSATLDRNGDNEQRSSNNSPKKAENKSNSETTLSPVKRELKENPVGSGASDKNKMPSANKKPAAKTGANSKKISNQQKSKAVPSKAASKGAVSTAASKKTVVKSLPSQKLKLAPKKVVKKKIPSKPVIKVKLKKTPLPKKVVKNVITNKQAKPNSQTKVSKKVTVTKSPTKTNPKSIKASSSKGSKNNVPGKQAKITKVKVTSKGNSSSKNSITKSAKPNNNKMPPTKKIISKQIIIAPSIGMAALERKISDLVNLMSGGNESKSPKLTLKKDARTGSLVITSEVEPTESKTPVKRAAQESQAVPKRKKVKFEPSTDAVDVDPNEDKVTNKQVVLEAQEKLKSSSENEVPSSETEFKIKEESGVPISKNVSIKSKKSTNNSVSKQVSKVEKTESNVKPATEPHAVSPKKKSSLPKIVLRTNPSRKTNTRNNKKNPSAKTKNNINAKQTRNVQSNKPVLDRGNNNDKLKTGRITKPNLKAPPHRKLNNQVDKITERNAKVSLSNENTSNLKQLTLAESMPLVPEAKGKQMQTPSQSKLQKKKVLPDKVDKLLVLDITGADDDIENDGYQHATENIKIPIIESYSTFSEPSAKAKNTLLHQNRKPPENVQVTTRLTRTTSNLKLSSRKSLNTPQISKQSISESGTEPKLKIDEDVIKIDDDIIVLDDEVIEVDAELPHNKKVLAGTETSTKPLTDEELLSLLTLRQDVQVECIIQKPITQGRSSLPSKTASFSQSKSAVSTRTVRSTSAMPSTPKNVAKTTANVASTSKIDRTSLIQELILNNIPKDDMHPKKLESYFRQLAMNLAASNAKEMSTNTTRSTETQTLNKNEDDTQKQDVVAACSGEPAVVNVDAEGDGVEMDPLLLEEEEEEEEEGGTNRGSEQASSGLRSDMTCKYCLQVFDTAIDCLRHKRQMHMFPKILLSTSKLQEYMNATDYSQCPICHRPIKLHPGQTSRNRNAYQKHLRTHSKDTSYTCSKCHKKFKREDYMKIHEKRHY